MSKVRVSVAIPVYNQEELIIKCINSVPKRDDIEIVVVDDCSTDNTLETLKQFDNIKLIHNEKNLGIGLTRNVLIENCLGDYIFFLDSDDYIFPDVFLDIVDNDLKNQIVLMPQCERNDGYVWYPSVHRGDFLKRDFINKVKHVDARCGEDSLFRDSIKKLPGFKLEKIPKLVYHYNEPRIDSLTWINRKNQNDPSYQGGIEDWEKYRQLEKELPSNRGTFSCIDIVVPYVDCSDESWLKLFNKYSTHKNKEEVDAINRFRGQGDFFKYFFRCIEKNMPWVRLIHLVVQSDSQVPKWINKNKVHIVKHCDFIPKEFLPTFNSTTIEMFLHRIPLLSNDFIYFNDDVFVVKPINQYSLFNNDKLGKSYYYRKSFECMWMHHIINSQSLIQNKQIKIGDDVLVMNHTMRPYNKLKMISCFNKYKSIITDSITRFREEKNFNIYLYDYYDISNGDTFKSTIRPEMLFSNSVYIDFTDVDVVCFQDTNENINIYENDDINNYFLKLYPNESEYEFDIDLRISKINNILMKIPEGKPRDIYRRALCKSNHIDESLLR